MIELRPESRVAAGEYGYEAAYFLRMLRAGAVDVLQADTTRCGGITGSLQADALCTAHSMPLSAHTAPSVHLHACCSVPSAIHLEYFHDHVRIENLLFDGVVKPVNGELVPDLWPRAWVSRFVTATYPNMRLNNSRWCRR